MDGGVGIVLASWSSPISPLRSPERLLKLSTWGVTLWMTWDVFRQAACVSECYAPLAQTWYGDDKVNAATQVDFATLKADMELLRNGKVPDINPPQPPEPPPIPPSSVGQFTGSLGAGGVITGTFTTPGAKGFGPQDLLAWEQAATLIIELLLKLRGK